MLLIFFASLINKNKKIIKKKSDVTSKGQALLVTLKRVLLGFEPKNPYLESYLTRRVPVILQNLFALFNTLTILDLIFKATKKTYILILFLFKSFLIIFSRF
jgi:hypothetical protein